MKKIIFLLIISLSFSKTIIVDENALCFPILGCFNACENGDYVTNTIRDALNNSSNGDIIKICPGSYRESDLEINKNITIEGLGNSPEDVNISSRRNYPIFYTSGWRDGVVLENFLIDERRNEDALYIDEGEKFLFKDLKIISNGAGIVVNSKILDSNFTNVYINSSDNALDIENSYNGLYLNNSTFISTNANAVNLNNIGGDLIIKNCEFEANNGDGIWINNSNYIDIENSYIHNTSNYGLYVNNNNQKIDMIGNLIENPGNYGVYIHNSSNPGEIKRNIIKNALIKGFYLLSSKEWRGYQVINNCFENGSDKNVFNRDEDAKFNENYYNDWSGSGAYLIPDIPVYDYNPWNSCNIFYTPQLDYRMDECSWDNDSNTYEIINYGNLGSSYDATALNDANVTTGKICNGGDIISSNTEDKAVKLKTDYALPSQYTLNIWIKFPLNTDGHKIFTYSYGSWWNRSYISVKYYNIADRKGSNKDFIYFTQIINDNTWTLNVNDDNRGDSYNFNPQNYNGWHMLTFVVSNNGTDFYFDGEKKYTFSTHPNTGYLGLLFNSDYYSTTDDKPNSQSIGADVDEFELYLGDLSSDEILKIYDNENNGKNYDGSERTCPICTQSQKNYAFNAVSKIIYNDAVKDWDNNLTTQIVNKPFNIYILSKDKDTNTSAKAAITKVIFEYFDNGNDNQCSGNSLGEDVICNDLSTNPCPDINNSSGEVEIKNIKIPKAVKCVEVYIQGRQLNNTKSLLQEANSTDDFAIRPYKFDIQNIPSKIKSGSEFNLTISALDYDNNPTKDYNETLHLSNTSVAVEYNITKSNCYEGELNLTSGENFKNGETNATFVYDEVGDLNLTIKEINGSEFAKVDEDDTPINQRLISSVTKTITIVPHHFYVNINVNNFDNNFTYFDNNLTVYSLIDLNITAENEQNQTTKNYNSKCYAKDVDVNLTPNIFRHSDKLSKEVFYKIFYVDSNSSIYKNKDINFSIGEGNFTTDNNGSAFIKIHVNFDRNSSIPQNPFEYNISNAEVNNSDINLTYFTSNGKALFYYGSLNMNDVITADNDFNVSHEFIIYDTNNSDTYLPPKTKEIIVNWFLNTLNNQKDANISNFVVTKNYTYDDNLINSIDVKINDINESLNLNIKRNDYTINFAVVHIIDSNASYLWYSKFGSEYNISKGSSCANHFCFDITWRSIENIKGVVTGDINGTKADVNESNETKEGVKIFR